MDSDAGVDLRPSYLLHVASGHLATIALPRPAIQVSIECVALLPGTSALLAAGMTHLASNPGASVIATIYQYGP